MIDDLISKMGESFQMYYVAQHIPSSLGQSVVWVSSVQQTLTWLWLQTVLVVSLDRLLWWVDPQMNQLSPSPAHDCGAVPPGTCYGNLTEARAPSLCHLREKQLAYL